MLVHKGGRINNVQLITGLRIADMSQLQNCSVMCTKNGRYCENEKKREKDRGGCVQRMEAIVKRKNKSGGGGGQGRCEWRSEAFVIFFFFFFFFFGGGGVGSGLVGWGGGVRVNGNGELQLFMGGVGLGQGEGGSGWGGWEQRNEACKKKNLFF